MNNSSDHMIRSINWNVQVGTYDEAIKINDRVQELSSTIGDTLAKVSAKYDLVEKVFLDQVMIDLGSLNESDIEEQLKQKFGEALHHELQDQIPIQSSHFTNKLESLTTDPVRSETRKENIVLHFLKNGSLPWWAENYDLKKISKLFMELIKAREQHFIQVLIQELRNERVAYRLVHQFEDKVVVEVMASLIKCSSKKLNSYLDVLKSVFSVNKKEKQEVMDRILVELAVQASKFSSEWKLIDCMAVIALKITKGIVPNPDLIKGRVSGRNEKKFLDRILDKMQDLSNGSKTTSKTDDEDRSLEAIRIDHPPNESSEAATDDNSEMLEKLDIAEEKYQDYFIKNSGLVILWPYLQEFFRSQELLQDEKFKSDTARVKAIHLLQFLSEESKEQPEYRLMLNKLLCGLDMEIPIPRKFKLTNKEEEACEELLEAIIQNWKALKGTSIEGLQSSFMMREGKLSKRSHGWTLVVESKAYDLLLDKMPWSISIIKLPWMNEPLYVEWT